MSVAKMGSENAWKLLFLKKRQPSFFWSPKVQGISTVQEMISYYSITVKIDFCLFQTFKSKVEDSSKHYKLQFQIALAKKMKTLVINSRKILNMLKKSSFAHSSKFT